MANVMDGGILTPRYVFMAIVSCCIAILGLLQSSVAVIIGAMLISPLMGPIVQLGFSLCVVDFRMTRQALVALLAGMALALLTAMSIVWMSPLREATSEILARTQPTLFDLLVALFSGLAGGYAVITRKGETIVGVAIATALMPPLAVVAYGLATRNLDIAGGAFFLFMTNLLVIALSVTLIAKWYGFGTDNSPQHTAWQAIVIVVTFAVLSIPLGLALRNIARQSWTAKQATAAIENYLQRHSGSIEQLKIDEQGKRYAIDLLLLVPNYLDDAQGEIQQLLDQELKHPSVVQVRQTLEANDTQAREKASIDTLRSQVDDLNLQVAELNRQAEPWVVLHVRQLLPQPSDVVVDMRKRKIQVTLPATGAGDAEHINALKERLAALEPRWRIDITKAPELPAAMLEGRPVSQDPSSHYVD
ncbi:MAG TPA: TIGR00341 family protein [Dyella sp.]|nr:TIGR00341 family protein [Dyella sp.]